jgi:diaminopimelate epimerase
MQLAFSKYHGTGNDFILVDETKDEHHLSVEQIAKLCHRHFGIGADGLMQLRKKAGYDFEMVYYNSDGKPSSMCGNGGRCIAQFAKDLGIVKEQAHFLAIDGDHTAIFNASEIELKMMDTSLPKLFGNDYVLNTGSPHYIKMVEHLEHLDVYKQGNTIRNSNDFKKEGINVNFVEPIGEGSIFVRTYERGVENETLSCGTGVTASALAYAFAQAKNFDLIKAKTLGGSLIVKFQRHAKGFEQIWLCGPVKKVFEGVVSISAF